MCERSRASIKFAYLLSGTLMATLCMIGTARAAIELPTMFSDGMVLQQQKRVPIHGRAKPNQPVTVTFADQTRTTRSDAQGAWEATLAPLEASRQPRPLTIKAGEQTEAVENVRVGEVWLCAGQSNMELPIRRVKPAQQRTAEENRPTLRVFTTEHNAAKQPTDQVKGRWQPTTPQTVGEFSAAAFFFGRQLQQTLDVPVGLIVSAWGGTPIRAWTSLEAQRQTPALRTVAAMTPKRASHRPGWLYNGMIHPWLDYPVRGFTWYQGEANTASVKSARLYETQLAVMIRDWRERWGDDALPFYFVQLPNWKSKRAGWVPMRQAMLEAHRRVENTGIAVTVDAGMRDNLHPKDKQTVGNRLARWALAQTYHRNEVVASGPLPRAARRNRDEVIVSFDHVAEGLRLKEAAKGEKKGVFEIAGADGRYVPAEARLEDGQLVLHAPKVQTPTAVRYAWQADPTLALFNSADLPASPFKMEIEPPGP